jgi:hypothetical protein
MKSVVHCCLGINSFIMGWGDKVSCYGLRAVPVGESCGVDLLLMWDAPCAAIPLICHFNVCLFLKDCCYRRNTLVMHSSYLVVFCPYQESQRLFI